jgi:hypothetical protein
MRFAERELNLPPARKQRLNGRAGATRKG